MVEFDGFGVVNCSRIVVFDGRRLIISEVSNLFVGCAVTSNDKFVVFSGVEPAELVKDEDVG